MIIAVTEIPKLSKFHSLFEKQMQYSYTKIFYLFKAFFRIFNFSLSTAGG